MMTSAEAAAAAGLSPSTFRSYMARHLAPAPTARRGNIKLWSVDDLQVWRPDLIAAPAPA